MTSAFPVMAEGTDRPRSDQEETWLTIIIHGILNAKPHISISNIILVLRDQLENTIYAHTIDITRNDPFFYQYHPMQKPGLQKIDFNDIGPGKAATAFARLYDEMSALNQKKPVKNVYYTFGWTGILGMNVRILDAQIFYDQLLTEINAYKAQGINPKIRIIGYSHGAHIALHLGTIHKQRAQENLLDPIDQIVLLGLPIVCDMDYLVHSPLFKKVYNLYSTGDRVQIADFMSYQKFLSYRTFNERPTFEVPDNLTQVQLRWKRLARTRKKYTYPYYPKWLIRNSDPGHSELFSFGWIYNYRQYVPFYPMPICCYVGYFLNAVENSDLNANHLCLEVHPFAQTMSLKAQMARNALNMPFLTFEQQQHFVDVTNSFRPVNFNLALFNERTAQTIELARQRYEEQNSCNSLATACE